MQWWFSIGIGFVRVRLCRAINSSIISIIFIILIIFQRREEYFLKLFSWSHQTLPTIAQLRKIGSAMNATNDMGRIGCKVSCVCLVCQSVNSCFHWRLTTIRRKTIKLSIQKAHRPCTLCLYPFPARLYMPRIAFAAAVVFSASSNCVFFSLLFSTFPSFFPLFGADGAVQCPAPSQRLQCNLFGINISLSVSCGLHSHTNMKRTPDVDYAFSGDHIQNAVHMRNL